MSTIDPEVHSLTGAYVCDALDPAERIAFERHLAQCPVCAQEVAELRETAALLASATAETPPPRLKAAVDAWVAVTRQLAPVLAHAPARPAAHRAHRRWFTVVGWGVATGLAAVVAVLGVRVGSQQHQIGQAHQQATTQQSTTQQSTTITALLSAPDARTDTAKVRTGGTGSVLVSRIRDEAAITVSGVTQPPPGKTYQLWMIGPSGIRSGGLLTLAANGSSGPVSAHGLGDALIIGLTVEPAGGSVQPTTTPVMLLPMPV